MWRCEEQSFMKDPVLTKDRVGVSNAAKDHRVETSYLRLSTRLFKGSMPYEVGIRVRKRWIKAPDRSIMLGIKHAVMWTWSLVTVVVNVESVFNVRQHVPACFIPLVPQQFAAYNLLNNERHSATLYPFIGMFNGVECPMENICCAEIVLLDRNVLLRSNRKVLQHVRKVTASPLIVTKHQHCRLIFYKC